MHVRAVVCSKTYQLSVMMTGKREESEFASVMAVEVQPDQHSQPIAMVTARLREESKESEYQVRAVVFSQTYGS